MRRSICICEPNIALAGTAAKWKFIYTSASTLAKGTKLRFDLGSKGREIDWQTPQTDLKQGNVIYAQLENGKLLSAKAVEVEEQLVPHFEFVLPEEIAVGAVIQFIIGPSPSDLNSAANSSQKTTQRRRTFYLHIESQGKNQFENPEAFYMDVRGGKLEVLRILTPSFVVKNKRFDVIVRFEDRNGNLTSKAPEDTLIELSYENLRENLNWKLFVPETGFLNLANLYFNEVGVYKIQLRNIQTGQCFHSFPIKCFAENVNNLYWGLLHGESERVDSTENIESCLRHFRDERAMNFFATSSFESAEETSNEIWKSISQNVLEFNEEDRFIGLLGFQFAGESAVEGLRQIIYRKDHKPILRKSEQKTNTLKKIYKSTLPKEILSIPCFTMGKQQMSYDFEDFTPEFERVVEIYNAWGSSECLEEEGNPRPIALLGKKGSKSFKEGSIRRALNRNRRFGFVAGGLDDRDVYADFYEGDQAQYTPGLTAVICEKHSREVIFDALYARSCYATTGERIIIGLFMSGLGMGMETDTAIKPGLTVNRHLNGYVAGTAAIQTVEIIRNGTVIKTFEPVGTHFDFTYDDMEPLAKIAIDAKDGNPPFVYYYMRVIQKDEHMAWSSPIWADCLETKGANLVQRKAKKG